MEIHVSGDGRYPDHVHGCPNHPGGTDAASRNPFGQKMSDACYWDSEHDGSFKTRYAPAYLLAQQTGSAEAST